MNIVDTEISLAQISKEIAECQSGNYGWTFSVIDEANQNFTVTMTAKDGEIYIILIEFQNYKLWPLLIDFIDPVSQEKGIRRAYPSSSAGFFHDGYLTICHPCNRKAYAGYTNLHADWGDPSGWLNNPNVGQLKTLKDILFAIFCRITNDNYNGRMV